MKNSKKTGILLSILGASTLSASVVSPMVKEFVANNSSSTLAADLSRSSSNNFMSMKMKYATNSSSSGYFEINDACTVISLFNYMGDKIWDFNVNDTKLQNYYDSNKVLAGRYANVEYTSPNYTKVADPKQPNRTVSLNGVKIYDAIFNDKDPSKIILLTGVTSGSDILLNVIQIDTVTGRPRINSVDSPDPIYNKTFSSATVQDGGKIFTSSSGKQPFLVASNGNAIVLDNTSNSLRSNYVITLDTNITTQVTSSVSISSIPVGYTLLNDKKVALVMASSTSSGNLQVTQLNSDFTPTMTMGTSSNSYTNLDISSASCSVSPFFYTSKDNQLIVFDKTGSKLSKFPLTLGSATKDLTVSGVTSLNGQNSTGTIAYVGSDGAHVVDCSTLSDKTISTGDKSSGTGHDIVMINSTFNNSGTYNNGSGALLKTPTKNSGINYWLKIDSGYSSIAIEQQESGKLKNSSELLQQNVVAPKLKYKLNKTVKFDEELKKIIGFDKPDASSSSPTVFAASSEDKLSLFDGNGELVDDAAATANPISTYYTDFKDGPNLTFDYQISHSSWWNDADKINYKEKANIQGFATEDQYFVRLKNDAPWKKPENKRFIPSKVKPENIFANIEFGTPEKTAYPTVEELKNDIVADIDTNPSSNPNDFNATDTKYIKLYANDDAGTLSIAYDFRQAPGLSPTDNKIPYIASKGVITISDLSTKFDFDRFYPENEKIVNLLNSKLSINVTTSDIVTVLPSLSAGYSSPDEAPSAWKWTNFDESYRSDESWKKNAWNNYLNGVLEYTGDLGEDTYDASTGKLVPSTRRLFFIPEAVPTASGDGTYTKTINGKEYTGKLYTDANKSGDRFYDTTTLTGITNSIYKRITGENPSNFDPANIESTIPTTNALKVDDAKLKTTFQKQITKEDVDAIIAGNEKVTRKVLRTLFDGADAPFQINNNWFNFYNVQLIPKFEAPTDGGYYYNGSLEIKIASNAPTNIKNGSNNLTFDQLGLNKDTGSIFDKTYTDLQVIDFSKIYETLKLQDKLVNHGIKLEKVEDSLSATIKLSDVSNKFAEHNSRLSASTALEDINVNNELNSSNVTVQKDFATKLNTDFTFLDTSVKYKQVSSGGSSTPGTPTGPTDPSAPAPSPTVPPAGSDPVSPPDPSLPPSPAPAPAPAPGPAPAPDGSGSAPTTFLRNQMLLAEGDSSSSGSAPTAPPTPDASAPGSPSTPSTPTAPVAPSVPTSEYAYTLEGVQASTNDNDGILTLVFKIQFYDPTDHEALPGSVGTKFISLNIDGFYSYKYELVMWSLFAVTLAIAVLSIILLCMWLRKERNKKRLWNIKK